MQSAAAPSDDRPASSRTAPLGDSASLSSSAPGASDEDGAEVEVPLALASDEEVLRRKSFDALEPHELVQLYRLMSRLELATPLRQTRRYEKGAPRSARRHATHPARQPAHRQAIRSASRAGAGALPRGGS